MDHPDYKDRPFLWRGGERHAANPGGSRSLAKRRERGGQVLTVSINENLDAGAPRESTVVALDDALISLAKIDENKARLVELRFFGGMTAEEIAEFLPDSIHRVRHEMRLALAWLHREVRQ